MEIFELNEKLEKIFTGLIHLYAFEDKLKEDGSTWSLYKKFENIDNEWEKFYHINNVHLLDEWIDIVSEIEYDYGKKNYEKNLKSLETCASKIIEELQLTDNSKITFEDKKQAKHLRDHLTEWKKFRYLKSAVKDLTNNTSELKNQISLINESVDKFSKLEDNVVKLNEESHNLIEDLRNKNKFLSQASDENSNFEIKKLYIDIYDTEIKIANDYRKWALSIFAVISLLLIWKFFNFSLSFNGLGVTLSIPSKKIGWESALNILLLIGLSTPAWYLARESSLHRKVAYKAQMLGTELASFPLYVREFKDEDRLELRRQLADRFFGQELFNDSKITSSSDNSLEQIKLLTEANKVLAEALKAKKVVE